MKLTSIVIPTYNALPLLDECIRSVRAHTYQPYEIIVVDNGSTDGTPEYCRQREITFISLPENRGFPQACNLGMTIASGDALLLLNNDVVVSHNWLANMLNCLYSADDIGIVGPTTNFASGKQQVATDYGTVEQFHRVAEKANVPDPGKWRQVNRLIGFCFLFRREVMERVGLLDERFTPGHYEDDDYCYRARMAGYRLMIAGDVLVHHHGSASFRKQDPRQVEELVKTNHRKFVEKWGFDPTIYI